VTRDSWKEPKASRQNMGEVQLNEAGALHFGSRSKSKAQTHFWGSEAIRIQICGRTRSGI
jgi:hypothetical protein